MTSTALNVRVYPEVLRTVAASAFTGSYQVMGGPLLYPCRIVKFTNTSAVSVTVSWDGTNDHDIIPAGGFLLIDVTSNREDPGGQLAIAAQTQFYIKASASTGSMYMSAYFAKGIG